MPNTSVPAAAPGLPLVTPAATDRARRAWFEFTDAMRDLVADGEGWMIVAGDRTATPDGAYMTLTRVHAAADPIAIEALETIDFYPRSGCG